MNLPIGGADGNTYDEITICSNGWASFEPTSLSHFWNFSIPMPIDFEIFN